MPDQTPLICAFEIGSDGAARVTDEAARAGDGAYTWSHYDLSAGDVAGRLAGAVPEIALSALTQAETRPRCDRLGDQLGDGIILNLRGVNLNPGASPEDMVSLRLWITADRIISARLRKIWAVDQMRQSMENGVGAPTVGAFIAAVAEGLTSRIESVSLELEEEIDRLEEDIVLNNLIEAQALIAPRASLIKLRRFIGPQREALGRLASMDHPMLTDADRVALRETANRAIRTVEALDAGRDRLSALQDHIEAAHASALGRNSYVLSVVAAIFLPLGFLTGLFGINVGGVPLVENPWGFWIVSLASALMGVGLFALFRKMKWL